MNEKKRHIDCREHRFTISVPTSEDPTLIECPKCSQKAFVVLSEIQPELGGSVKVVCPACGFSKEKTTTERAYYWHEDEPSDGYFDYRLWMRIPCCGNSLWAFNRRHLELLENFVQAELRERPKGDLGYSNSSISSRLPKWLQSSKNREKVLECLAKLRVAGGYGE